MHGAAYANVAAADPTDAAVMLSPDGMQPPSPSPSPDSPSLFAPHRMAAMAWPSRPAAVVVLSIVALLTCGAMVYTGQRQESSDTKSAQANQHAHSGQQADDKRQRDTASMLRQEDSARAGE